MVNQKLVIVESPTKAKTIGKMLGRSYKVMPTVGHLRDLPKSKMGVDIEKDFTPQYINVRGKAPIINELKKNAKEAKEVFLATDPDREGEAISWHLCYLLGIDPAQAKRVCFSEITKEQVQEKIKAPRPIDMKLVDAQQARRILDRVVGYSLSPILWKKIKAGLSAGRVQSVALRLLCEREKEIRSFVPEEYWEIKAQHDNNKFSSEYIGPFEGKKKKKVRIDNETQADSILDQIDLSRFEVQDIEKKKKKTSPYPPYTTSTLQQDAYSRLGFSTQQTMRIAQQLYEGISVGKEGTVGLITYMRTDSTRISDLAIHEALNYIHEYFGKAYVTKGKKYGVNKKGAQDAHEAIRPSSFFRDPDRLKSFLTQEQYKLYRLIWERALASQMSDYEYLSTSIWLVSGGHLFQAKGNIKVFAGFTEVYPFHNKENVILPEYKIGEIITDNAVEKIQKFTKPKPRYTEASLVKTLEEDGIGRPSTYSSIIQSLISRHYAVINEKKFFTTPIGERVDEFLAQYFSKVINEEFTAQLETQLDKIAEEDVDYKKMLHDFYGQFKLSLDHASQSEKAFKIDDKPVGRKCPECGHELLYKYGRNGKFIGCSNFPECKHTEAIIVSTGVPCPKCGGELIQKISKRGKLFYGCNQYPDCDFALWDEPINEKCPQCGSILVHKKDRKTNEIRCSHAQCNYRREIKKDKE